MVWTKRIATLLLVLGLGLGATACGGDDTSDQSEQIEQLESEVKELQEVVGTEAEPTPLPDPGLVRKLEFFSSPTGNIGCSMADDGVRCDVRQASWNPPPKPANCELDWGQGVSVGDGKAGYVCAGDTTLGGQSVLQYGETSKIGNFSCESSEAGIRCENTSTGHGFGVSRDAVELF